MKRLAAAFLLLLPLLSSPIHAQDAAPWPPDPETIFAPGVEVVSVEVKAPHINNLPTYDNKTRIIRVYDEAKQQWQEFPYPDEIDHLARLRSRTGSPILDLYTALGDPYGTTAIPEAQWLLNTDTGEFSRPELACGEIKAEAGQGKWVVQSPDNDKTFFLCNTESRKEVGPLPLKDLDYLRNARTSPDGKHVAMFGQTSRVYSYAFDTNTLIVLGHSSGNEIQVAEWIDNQHLFIYTTNRPDMSFPWRSYSLADATKPDSLKWIETTIKPNVITSLRDPSRTQWITYTDDNKCLFTELNWETGKITDYDLDVLCTEGTVIPDGSNDRLYFEFTWPDEAFSDMGRAVKQPLSSKVVRYNPYTGKRTDLLNGEIEWVKEISPDGLYAVVVTDDDGCFEAYPREDPDNYLPPCESEKLAKPQQVLINLKTGEKLYQQATEWSDSLDGRLWYACYDQYTKTFQNEALCVATLSAGPLDSWTFIDDRLLLQVAYPDNNVEYSLISLRGDRPQKQVIGLADELRYLPASQQFLLTRWRPTSPTTKLATDWLLYDMQTGQLTPFIEKFVDDHYSINFGDDSADTLIVTLSLPYKQWVNGQLDSVERYVYTIRFPKH